MDIHDRIVQRLLAWFEENARDLPWRRTSDPYGIWISEIMLQQTRVETVLPYWKRWMWALPSVHHLAEADSQRLHKLWEGLGYYTRVRNLQKAARQILQFHGGKFPTQLEEVLALPGVGRYTAGAICSIAFDQPAPILDGNVTRVLTRLFGIGGNPRTRGISERLWKLAGELVLNAATHKAAPRGFRHGCARPCSSLNQSLMELGALICTPRNPSCSDCPLRADCVARRRGLVDDLPALPRRPKATPRHFLAFVILKQNRVLLGQRSEGVVNGHLWEFPTVEIRPVKGRGLVPADSLAEAARTIFMQTPCHLEPLCRIKHTITRYRVTT